MDLYGTYSYVRDDATTGTGCIELNWDSGSGIVTQTHTDVNYTDSITHTLGTNTILVRGRGVGTDYMISNVNASAIPEPSVLAFLLVAGGLLIRYRLRK